MLVLQTPENKNELSNESEDDRTESTNSALAISIDPNQLENRRTAPAFESSGTFTSLDFDFAQSKKDLLQFVTDRSNAEALFEYILTDGQRFSDADLALESSKMGYTTFFDAKLLKDQLALEQQEKFGEILGLDISIGTVTIASTAGFVLWSLRGGLLIATALSHMPSWKMIDPLPILDSYPSQNREEKEFEGIF